MNQHLQLIDRAKSYGIQVTDISNLMQCNAVILDYNDVSELVIDGVPTSWINARGQFYCDNKQLTKRAYETLNIPYPKSITFQNPTKSSDDLSNFFKKNETYVCKPLDATNGIGVVLGIENMEMLKAYYEQFKYLNTLFLLEEYVKGDDLRIHVIKGKIVAACIREPAFVIGNGIETLETLIEKRRAVMKNQNPNNFLEIDKTSLQLLEKQQITLADVPALYQKIRLKNISNMAQGGVATDVTDEIHTDFQHWVTGLSNYLGTGYFGLDLITTDVQAPPHIATKVLEINARADWLHHTFSEKRIHDMSGIILNTLFK